MDQTAALLHLAEERGLITARDLEAHGLPRRYLSRLAARGELERVGRGLYARPGCDVSEHHDLAVVAKRVPRGVVCLLSALRFHGLTTQAPPEVWLALPPNTWEPEPDVVPLRTVRMSDATFAAGVEAHVVDRVPVRVFSAAKTVADCFRFRRLVGLGVALDALRELRSAEAIRSRGSFNDLWHYAEVDRVQNVLRPYLEAAA